jgi:hypothetical protein
LLALGISREKTVLNLYIVSLLCLILAFSVFYVQGRMLPLFLGFLFLIFFISGQISGVTKNWFKVSSQLGNMLALRKETQWAIDSRRWLLLEVERRATADELWKDYRSSVEKLGFCLLRLVLPDGSISTWQVDGLDKKTTDLWHVVHDMCDGTVIEFYADKATISPTYFHLFSELAAETWLKIASRWRVINREPFHFQSTASTPQNRFQKEFVSLHGASSIVSVPPSTTG